MTLLLSFAVAFAGCVSSGAGPAASGSAGPESAYGYQPASAESSGASNGSRQHFEQSARCALRDGVALELRGSELRLKGGPVLEARASDEPVRILPSVAKQLCAQQVEEDTESAAVYEHAALSIAIDDDTDFGALINVLATVSQLGVENVSVQTGKRAPVTFELLGVLDRLAWSQSLVAVAQAPTDPEASPFDFHTPVTLVFARFDRGAIKLVWADQHTEDPIVANHHIVAEGDDEVSAKKLQGVCGRLSCQRVLLEAPPDLAARRAIALLTNLGEFSQGEPKVELTLMDQTLLAAERATHRIGMHTDFGEIPAEAVNSTVRTAHSRLVQCMDSAPNEVGVRMVVRFLIGPTGKASDAVAVRPNQLSKADLQQMAGTAQAKEFVTNPDVERCVEGLFKELEFPAPDGGSVRVLYPLKLSR